MRWLSFVLVLLAAVIAHAMSPTIRDAYVPLPPPGQTTAAMFLTVHNPYSEPLFLVDASSPLARDVEFHTHQHTGGQMQMRAVTQIELPPKSDTTLRPGGLHLMLFKLKRPLKVDDEVTVLLSVSDGSQLQAVARVRDMRR